MERGAGLLAAALAYLALLFAIAWYGDKRADAGRSLISRGSVYALSLAVYATSWTFYGSVGLAATSGWGYAAIYLGPTLACALFGVTLRKTIRIARANRITTISDFIGSRYGKSGMLAGLVTVFAVIGSVPYIALQLKAVAMSVDVLLAGPGPHRGLAAGTAFYVALLLAAFTILFGTRHMDATERHEGMVAAVAFESVVKLVAFLSVGVFAVFVMYDGPVDLFRRALAVPGMRAHLGMGTGGTGYTAWASMLLMSVLAVVLLPRQFQIAVVENVDEDHLRQAMWLFPLYLLVISLFVMPIALAGAIRFPSGAVQGDAFVLALPLAEGHATLALLVFIGGLSAGTAMVIVETIALSTMLCNDLVMPLLLRIRALRLTERTTLAPLVLAVRRGCIVVLLMLGYAGFRATAESYALANLGLLSFAAAAQLAPVFLGGLYWRHGSVHGAIAAVCTGFAVWAYTLLLPAFARAGLISGNVLDVGPFGRTWLNPLALFGLQGLDEISHGLLWSLLANVAVYVGGSLLRPPGAAEQGRVAVFVDAAPPRATAVRAGWGTASAEALQSLAARFLGADRAHAAFADYAGRRGLADAGALQPDAALREFAETLLAGAIGAASSRVLVASVIQDAPPGLDEVVHMLDETSQVIASSRALEQAHAELKAANARLQEVDQLKDDFISTVTHELRTPLTSIRAFSEILRDHAGIDVAQRTEYLDIIVKESDRLTRLINQVLDLAKLESGRAAWVMEQVDVVRLAGESAGAMSELFRERGVTLEVALPGAPAVVVADRDRLMQVLLNLLSNAVKFSPRDSGLVRLEVSTGAGSVRVAVRDNGCGIDAADQGIIFEKFRQARRQGAARPRGTGLGLSISRQIIDHLGGRLSVESIAGQGATFWFTLPQAATVGAAEPALQVDGWRGHGAADPDRR